MKVAAKASKTRAGRPAKKKESLPKKVSATDGRRIPVSPATARAERAADRATAALGNQRTALAAAKNASDKARTKARKTGATKDKTVAKKARRKVQRIAARVVTARTAARKARVRVVELKAQDRLNARRNNVERRLEKAAAIASGRIDTRLEKATETFRATKRAELVRVEKRKANKRKRVADGQIAKLQREYDSKVRTAQASLEPKPRKKRKRRARSPKAA